MADEVDGDIDVEIAQRLRGIVIGERRRIDEAVERLRDAGADVAAVVPPERHAGQVEPRAVVTFEQPGDQVRDRVAVEVAEIGDAELLRSLRSRAVNERLHRRRSVRDETDVAVPQARGIDVEAEQRVRRQDAARIAQRRVKPAGVADEAIPVAGHEMAVDQLAHGMGMLWRDRQEPFEAGDGVVEALELAQQASAIVERVEVLGCERQRCVESGEGVVVAGEARQRIAAVEMDLRVAGVDRTGALEAMHRVRKAPQLVERGTAVAPVRERARIERNGAVVALDCFLLAAEFGQCVGAVAVRVRQCRVSGNGGVEARQRGWCLTHPDEREAEQIVGARVCRVDGNGASGERDAVVEPVLPAVHLREKIERVRVGGVAAKDGGAALGDFMQRAIAQQRTRFFQQRACGGIHRSPAYERRGSLRHANAAVTIRCSPESGEARRDYLTPPMPWPTVAPSGSLRASRFISRQVNSSV